MEIGEIGGLNYRMNFPQQQMFEEPQPVAGQQGGEQYQYPKDPIAHRKQLTSDYYDNAGLLRAFMKEHGADAAKPDWSQEGGGLAFQTFQALQANVMLAANALSREAEAEDQMRPLIARGDTRVKQGVDQSGLYAQDPNNFTPTAIDPLVMEANNALEDPRYTQGDSNRLNQAVRDPRVKYYQEQIQRDPGNAEYYQRQVEALLKNTPQTAYQQLVANERNEGNLDKKSMMNLFQRVANHTRGVFPEGTYKTKIVGGEQYSVSEDFKGDSFGRKTVYKTDKMGNTMPVEVERKIVSTLKDPKGNTFLQLDDGEMVNVTNMPPDEVFRTIVESNSGKYGGAGSLPAFYNELGRNNLLSANRTVPTTSVFGEGSVEQSEKARPNIPGFDRIQQTLKTQFNQLTDPDSKLGIVKIEGSDGTEYKFSYNDKDGVHLSNWEDLAYTKEDRPKNITFEKYLDLLDQMGAWDRYMGKKQEPQKKTQLPSNLTSRQQQALVQFGLKFNRDPNEAEMKKLLDKFK
jgi:hypothetical protein